MVSSLIIKKEPKLKRRNFDIIRGARTSDREEIENALNENSAAIVEQAADTLETALHITCRLGFYHATMDLLQADGIDFSIKDMNDKDVLDAAMEGGHPGIMDAVGQTKYPHLKHDTDIEPK